MMDQPKIGAYVLETLTTGMYIDPLDTIREYVQNATDSIIQAEKEHLLNQNCGKIEIVIDSESRKISIRDNGIGINKADLISKLLNIGMSSKQIGVDAGFRGIGRLAGIAYCEKLVFETSSYGENILSILEFNCMGIKQAITPSKRQTEELIDVITRNTKVEFEKIKKDDHFFEVSLYGVNEDTFLNWTKLEYYLCQVAPVDFDAQNFLQAPKIAHWVHINNIKNPTVTLTIKEGNTERQILKPYRNTLHTKRQRSTNYDFRVKDVKFYPEKIDPSTKYWYWYGETDLLGQINDEKISGIRFRLNNIAIGRSELVEQFFTEKRFNAYYIGEIYIIDPNIIPNARRDGFEDTDENWQIIKTDLHDNMQNLSKAIRETSNIRNTPLPKIKQQTKKLILQIDERVNNGFVTKDQKTQLLQEIEKQKELVKIIKDKKKDTPEEQILDDILTKLNDKSSTVELASLVGKNLKSDLSRKERNIISRILEIIRTTLDDEKFALVEKEILKEFGLHKKQ